MPQHTIVIGAGFAGLSAASYLARGGARVTLLERHGMAGGRARTFSAEGFRFDMGPSWYWMPDVFERYFADFGTSVAEQYDLVRLDPSYRVVFGDGDALDIPAKLAHLYRLCEDIEPGSARRLKKFLAEAQYKYEVGMSEFVEKPSHSLAEFADVRVAQAALKLHMLKDMEGYVDEQFADDRLRQVLKFPVLFLGAKPANTPALYSLMNYADLVMGTWYPMGGMHKMVEAMVRVAKSQGVDIRYDTTVRRVATREGRVVGVETADGYLEGDAVVGAADYHHVEQHLLAPEDRQYTEDYWDRRTMAPSSLLYYVGVRGKLPGIKHHTLFFDRPFDLHAEEIYERPQWPSDPLFYVCAPSVTDASVAPPDCENLFVLVPTAPGLGGDSEVLRKRYFDMVMDRYERHVGAPVRERIVYSRSYAETNFEEDYSAYKGNAYGLANTLRQTAFLKPKMKSARVDGLYYAGQLTTPGPGVPPSLVSGRVAAGEILRDYDAPRSGSVSPLADPPERVLGGLSPKLA